jgi:hypothetical protein
MKVLRALCEMLARLPALVFGARLAGSGPSDWERERLHALDAELEREGKAPVGE